MQTTILQSVSRGFLLSAFCFSCCQAPAQTISGNGTITGNGILSIYVPPPTLTVLTNLKVWLAADATVYADGTVTNWPDSSTNHFNATNSAGLQPTYVASAVNGKPAYYFDGSRYLVSPFTTVLSNCTTLVVCRMTNWASQYQCVFDKNSRGSIGIALYFTLGNDHTLSFQAQSIAPTVESGTGWLIGGGRRAGDEVTVYGPTLAHATLGGGGTGLSDTSPLTIGRFAQTTYLPFSGYIAEMIIWDTALSESDLSTAFGYLHAKYGLP